jgi:Tfp pilus assembly protein PilO
MMDKINQALGKLDPRVVWLLMSMIVGLLVIEGWFLVLRKPYMEYRQIVATHASLSESLSQSPDPANELEKLATELRQLSDKLTGELHLPASDDKMAASLMESLDHSAAAHNVMLSGVKPRERKPVSVFEEVSFEVGAKGSYLHLCAWMLDFDKTLGNNATITEFDMKTPDGQQVLLTQKIALYRPLKPVEAQP